MIDPAVSYFGGRDGAELAYREVGEGRPVILIHGFLASSEHWLRFGHAARLAALGYRVVMPDVRAHGDSDRSHDASAYPPDILAEDGFALVEHLGLGVGDYDLGGYSLGGRTTIRMLARGGTPGRAIVGGMGLEGIVHTAGRGGQFRHLLTNLGTFEFGSADWKAEAYLRKIGADPVALLLALGTTVDTSPEALAAIETPTLIVVGARGRAPQLRRGARRGSRARAICRRPRRPRERDPDARVRRSDHGLSRGSRAGRLDRGLAHRPDRSPGASHCAADSAPATAAGADAARRRPPASFRAADRALGEPRRKDPDRLCKTVSVPIGANSLFQ